MKKYKIIWLITICGLSCTPFIDIDPASPPSSSYAIILLTSDNPTGETETQLSENIVVRVERLDKTPVFKANLQLTILEGEGRILSPNPIPTDTLGIIAIQWELGPIPGSQLIEITGIDFPNDASIKVRATALKKCPQQVEFNSEYYPTVLIQGEVDGNIVRQCWLARNLNVGERINVADQIGSLDASIQKHCYDDLEINCQLYGGFYTWLEAMDRDTINFTRSICPPGWRIPTDLEWQLLERIGGMNQEEAQQRTSCRGTTETPSVGDWLKSSGGSGFEALLGGSISLDTNDNIVSSNLHKSGSYWTATNIKDGDKKEAITRYFATNCHGGIGRGQSGIYNEANVRCIQN